MDSIKKHCWDSRSDEDEYNAYTHEMEDGHAMLQKREIPIALRGAYLALHRASESQFARFGVTADQFVLLASLVKCKALTQKELAQRMSSDPSTVRAMLVLLENAGLVQRQSHPEDARAKTVTLTPAGKRRFKQLWKAGEPIRDTLYETLAAHEVDSLVEMLNRISAALNVTENLSSEGILH